MVSQKNKVVVITGATGGIGFQSALEIAKTGARVIITGRNRERGIAAAQQIKDETGNDNVDAVIGDLSSIAGVDGLAKSLLVQVEHIDVLVNNAGYFGDVHRVNDDGIEMHFAVNALAPWRLTMALLPALKAAGNARVLNVTGGDKPGAIDIENLQAEKGFKGLLTYKHSKGALESASLVMAEKLEPHGITVNILFPGRAATVMTSSLSSNALPGLLKLIYPVFRFMFKEDGGKSAAKAARSTIWAVSSPDLDDVTGRYFDTNSKEQKLHPSAYEKETQAAILAVIDAAKAGGQM